MKYEDKLASTDKEKALLFNNFFASVFTKSPENLFYPEIDVIFNQSLANLIVDETDVLTLLHELDVTKAPGPDGIPTRILKECAASLKSFFCI